jgi:hypothetical protein
MTVLHDPTAIDLALSLECIATSGLALLASLRSVRSSARGVWLAISVALVVYLLNQQGDLHRSVLWWGSDVLEAWGIGVRSRLVLTSCAALVALLGGIAGLALVRLTRGGHPPGRTGVVGLSLFATAALVRSASLLHLLPDHWVDSGLVPACRAVAATGLALVALAAARWPVGGSPRPAS